MRMYCIYIVLFFCITGNLFSVDRNGTTTLNFLEIDIGSSRAAMGGAGVSFVKDASASFWNPGGLAFLSKKDVIFFNQGWIADINHTYTSMAIPIDRAGVFALSFNVMDYGDIEDCIIELFV